MHEPLALFIQDRKTKANCYLHTRGTFTFQQAVVVSQAFAQAVRKQDERARARRKPGGLAAEQPVFDELVLLQEYRAVSCAANQVYIVGVCRADHHPQQTRLLVARALSVAAQAAKGVQQITTQALTKDRERRAQVFLAIEEVLHRTALPGTDAEASEIINAIFGRPLQSPKARSLYDAPPRQQEQQQRAAAAGQSRLATALQLGGLCFPCPADDLDPVAGPWDAQQAPLGDEFLPPEVEPRSPTSDSPVAAGPRHSKSHSDPFDFMNSPTRPSSYQRSPVAAAPARAPGGDLDDLFSAVPVAQPVTPQSPPPATKPPPQPPPQEPPPQQPPPQPRGLDLDSLFGGGFSPVRAASTPEHAAPVLSFDPQPAPLELEAEFAACPAAAPDCPETIEVSVMLRERVDADLLAGEMQSYSLLAEVLALGKRPILDPGPPQPDDPPSTVVTFYLALEGSPHVEPDPKYVSSGPTPGSWTVRLRISDEEGPRRGAITLLRYRQGRNPQSALPVRARVVWQSAPAAAPDGAPAVHDQLTLDWKVNPAVRLESLGFLVDAGSSVAAPVTQESRPPGQWSRERRQLLWRAVENGQMSAPEGRLQARFLAAAAAGAPDTSAEELCAAHQQQRRAVLCRFKGDARGPMGGARVEFFRDRDLKLPLTLTGGVAHQFLSGGEFTLR